MSLLAARHSLLPALLIARRTEALSIAAMALGTPPVTPLVFAASVTSGGASNAIPPAGGARTPAWRPLEPQAGTAAPGDGPTSKVVGSDEAAGELWLEMAALPAGWMLNVRLNACPSKLREAAAAVAAAAAADTPAAAAAAAAATTATATQPHSVEVRTEWWLVQLAPSTARDSAHQPLPPPRRTFRVNAQTGGGVRQLAGGRTTPPEGADEMARSAERELRAVRVRASSIGVVAALEEMLRAAGLSARRSAEGDSLHLDPLPHAACSPPLPAELLTHHAQLSPVLQALPSGGWKASIRGLSPPVCEGCDFAAECVSGGLLAFDGSGAHFSYSVLTGSSLQALLLDLQSLAMSRALLQRLSELRAADAPGLSRLRLLRASCSGLLLLTAARKQVLLQVNSLPAQRAPLPATASATPSAAPAAAATPAAANSSGPQGVEKPSVAAAEGAHAGWPYLQLRVWIDGAPPPAAALGVIASLPRSCSLYDMLSCEALAPTLGGL